MVMVGYFDESGTHGKESPITAVAGFIATADQWVAYERDLTDLFREYGVTRFHAKDFRGNKGDFKKWEHSKKGKFNSRFLKLADDHLAAGVSIVLQSLDYDRVYRSLAFPARARPDTKYGLCVRCAIWKTMVLAANRERDWPIDIVLEDGHKNAGDAIRVFDEVKESLHSEYANMLGLISFASKDSCTALAIADSLAYAIFRMSAGYSRHPTIDHAAVVGPADPPYMVQRIPLSRTLVDETTLISLRDNLRGL